MLDALPDDADEREIDALRSLFPSLVVPDDESTAALTPMQRSEAVIAAMPRMVDVGIGQGIDADGVYRFVRLDGIEERRAQLAVDRAADLGVAMRDFVKAIPEKQSGRSVRGAGEGRSHGQEADRARGRLPFRGRPPACRDAGGGHR